MIVDIFLRQLNRRVSTCPCQCAKDGSSKVDPYAFIVACSYCWPQSSNWIHGSSRGLSSPSHRKSKRSMVTTNMRLKLIMNSKAKAWPYPPDGTVTPPPIMGLNISLSANAAQSDAITCVPMYTGTYSKLIGPKMLESSKGNGDRWVKMGPRDVAGRQYNNHNGKSG